jgi:homoserine O-succinyltransferase/O-acetyltransferase
MKEKAQNQIRVAILDLYEGHPNQGMRGLREILNQFGDIHHIQVEWDEFDVRLKKEIPDMSYDIYISSGGPGSPLESEGSEWDNLYIEWLDTVMRWNQDENHTQKKFVLFICHSFQIMCRHLKAGNVCKRRSTSFGVFPVHLLTDGHKEIVFEGLRDPFYAVDSRDYQVIQPDHAKLRALGAKILCIEKDRPHVPLERAVMAIRFNEQMIGTQFHPEADAIGMSMYLQRDDKKNQVIEIHGLDKWSSMIDHLNDPDKIMWTYAHIVPNFLMQAVEHYHASGVSIS